MPKVKNADKNCQRFKVSELTTLIRSRTQYQRVLRYQCQHHQQCDQLHEHTVQNHYERT